MLITKHCIFKVNCQGDGWMHIWCFPKSKLAISELDKCIKIEYIYLIFTDIVVKWVRCSFVPCTKNNVCWWKVGHIAVPLQEMIRLIEKCDTDCVIGRTWMLWSIKATCRTPEINIIPIGCCYVMANAEIRIPIAKPFLKAEVSVGAGLEKRMNITYFQVKNIYLINIDIYISIYINIYIQYICFH